MPTTAAEMETSNTGSGSGAGAGPSSSNEQFVLLANGTKGAAAIGLLQQVSYFAAC